jgi:two-component system chemotaxis sensor kinase CheA
MFNFDDLVSLSHKAENLLDEIRDEKVILDANLSSLFMRVKDAIEALIEAAVNGVNLDDKIKESILIIEDELVKNMPNITSSIKTIKEENKEDAQPNTLWHISLRFEPEFLKSGMDILSILKYFLKYGEILLNTPIFDNIPVLDQFNPIEAYMGFEIDFQSDCTKDDIVEIFEFVEDDIDLIVFNTKNKKEFEDLFNKREDDLKQILIDNFSYEEDKKEQAQVSIPKQEPRDECEILDKNIIKKPIIKLNDDTGFFLRVNSKKIDELINKVSQMVIKSGQLDDYALSKEDETLEDMAYSMNTLLEDIRDSVMNIRMVQVKDSFIKYRRIVNDTANKLNKKIDFILEGENTELDKSVVEKLSDPLTHMIRNSCDHGIEDIETRISKGKSPQGKIILKTYPDAGTIVIEIKDDGAGINKEAILKKAIANGIVDPNHNLDDKEIYKLIFSAGLSTADAISDISGRGVGMDVVKRNIEDLRGTIEVNSAKDRGSTIKIRLPLTLAIIDGFLVQSGHSKFIIPVETISQCMELTDEYRSKIKGANTINLRGEVLPLLNLRKFYQDKITSDELEFDEDEEDEYRQNVVIVRYASSEVGLLVDELYGQQQVVIKSLGGMFGQIPGISGGSILGSGEIALILDIAKLIENQIIKGE